MTWGDDIAAKLLGGSLPAGFQSCLALWETSIAPCPLIDLTTLKAALGITDNAQDDELNRLITSYSQSIENYIERQLCEAAREVVYAAKSYCNVPALMVPQWPIVSVDSLEIDGTLIDADGYVTNDRLGYIYPNSGNGWTINHYALLKYTSGYNPIPADLQDAMVQMIQVALTSSGSGATGPLKSQRVEGAVTEQYYDPRSVSSVSSGSADVGYYYSTLDYYRGERAFL